MCNRKTTLTQRATFCSRTFRRRSCRVVRPSNLQSVKPATLQMTSDQSYGLAVITFRLPGSDSDDSAAAAGDGRPCLSSHRSDLLCGWCPAGKALSVEFALGFIAESEPGLCNGAAFPEGRPTARL